ncbi:hypothetical protein FHR83_005558 [Actinoplanes campanulatus]|uniref:DNA primase/polymerase bifunctional N-terminal domain-containing protein n=1 Tax=Actinoplanes campanulatus TaxID=113559 RepID=A0A7W5ALB1_9ACTN|nr:bifunctional DNA primase/polymerase [Actinoplanes campanulatus]MBB3097874.1 hypothetical protein [Actinoplanes campanulatus]GGN22431.1 hypothetical protein GCM10010109_37030 [Actinoplanes campanulatus]GID34563.1 hypothetical protein Aca09nite_10690 [Actinoplanes campanulatus]
MARRTPSTGHSPRWGRASTPVHLGPPGDVRRRRGACEGYLVGPGSVIDGLPYTVTHDLPIAPLPAWLTRKLTGRGRAGVTAAGVAP